MFCDVIGLLGSCQKVCEEMEKEGGFGKNRYYRIIVFFLLQKTIQVDVPTASLTRISTNIEAS